MSARRVIGIFGMGLFVAMGGVIADAQTATAPTIAPSAETNLLDIPDAQQQAAAQKTVDGAYATKLATSDPEVRKSVLTGMIEEARQGTGNSVAERYVLLQTARKEAIRQGDVNTALLVIKELGGQFKIDVGATRLESAQGMQKSAEPSVVIDLYLKIASDAMEAGDTLLATKAVNAATSQTLRLTDKIAAKDAVERCVAVRDSIRDRMQIRRFESRLAEAPDDATANQQVGWYWAVKRGDWPKGLGYLAKSGDPALKAVATAEAIGPTSPTEMADLADTWWEWSSGKPALTSEEVKAIRWHAKEWYGKSVKGLTGLRAKTVEARIEEIAAAGATRMAMGKTESDPRGLKFEWFDGQNFETKVGERIDSKISTFIDKGIPGDGGRSTDYSVRWSGFIRPPKSGRYKFSSQAEGGIRLKINGTVVIDSWNQTGWRSAEVELSDDPQEIVFEMKHVNDMARVVLVWALPGQNISTVIPPTVFFQTRDAAAMSWRPEDPTSGPGLEMTLFSDKDLKKSVGTGTDANIDWWFASKPPILGMKSENFSIRWKGFILPPKEGDYQFKATFDDGARLWIDGSMLFDSKTDPTGTSTRHLTPEPHEIILEYWQEGGDAFISLHWSLNRGFHEQIIPPSAFFMTRESAMSAMAARNAKDKSHEK